MSAAGDPVRRPAAWIGGALLAGWALAALAPRDFPAGTFVDDAQYVVLARSLRERHDYRTLNLPGAPAETKFPPGLPLVLATVWSPAADGPANLERARYVNLTLLGPLAALLAAAGIVAFRLDGATVALAAVAGLASAPVTRLWTVPMAEPLGLALVAAGLMLAARRRWIGSALVMAAATLVRAPAAAFLVSVPVLAWRQGERRAAVSAAAAGLAALAPWVLWTLLRGGETPAAVLGVHGPYGAWYLEALRADPATVLVTVPLRNLVLAAQAAGEALVGWRALPVQALAAIGAVVIGLAGRGRSARGATLGLGLYAALILAWPFPVADRMIGGIWPLVLLCGLAALPPGRVRRLAAAAALALAVVSFGRGEGVRAHRVAGTAAAGLLRRIRPVVSSARVLAASNPPLYYLSLGVPVVPNERMRSWRWYRQGYWASAWGLGDDLWAILERYRPDDVVVERRGPEGRWAVGSLLRQCPGVLDEIWRSAEGEAVYRARYGASCAPVSVER